MDAIFNIKCFGNLLRREFTYTWKTFLYIVTGLVVYFIVAKLLDSTWEFKFTNFLPIFGLGLIVCGVPFINKNLNKANSVSFLSTPASNFEKWLLMWCKSVVITPILVIGTILLLDQISPIQTLDEIISTDYIPERIHFIYAFQSVFFFGYIYFKERSLVKSGIIIPVLFMLAYILSKVIISQFYPEIIGVVDSLNIFEILNFNGFYQQTTDSFIETGTTVAYYICLWIIKLIFPLGLWVLSYIKLREREI
ncbi:hypothetical protein [Dysgonomonas reticulitermitis]